jgi:chromosomal replication initiation ATPase DnaA
MTLDSILFYTCDQQNVSADEVKSRSRKGEVVKARQIFTAIAASYGYAFVDIMHFVGRNRTTAYNSMKIANWQLRKEVENCRVIVGHQELIAHVGRRAQKRRELREYFEKHPVT